MTVDRLRGTFETLMTRLPEVIARPEPDSAVQVLGIAAAGAAGAAAPMLLAAAGVALAGGAAQGGLKISSKRFKPKFEHLNVGNGVKRMFSGHAAWGLAKTLLKFAVLGAVAWSSCVPPASGSWPVARGRCPPPSAPGSEAALKLIRVAALVGLAVAGLDYLMERRRVEKGMRMSRDEIKHEHNQSEGDPHQKGALRGRQREISRNRMMADVATADVILVNPTHVAVALKYESGSRRAPRRGQGRRGHGRPDPGRGREAPPPDGRGRAAGADAVRRVRRGAGDPRRAVRRRRPGPRVRHGAAAPAGRSPACTPSGRWRSPGRRRGAILRSRAARPMGSRQDGTPTGPGRSTRAREVP